MFRISGYKATFILGILIFFDQASKYIIRHSGGFYVCNPHIAFGIELPSAVFFAFWGIILGFIGYALLGLAKHNQISIFRIRLGAGDSQLPILALILILAGALSNMTDRLMLGCVVDFIDFKNRLPLGLVWPVFNLADILVCGGAAIFFVKMKKMC